MQRPKGLLSANSIVPNGPSIQPADRGHWRNVRNGPLAEVASNPTLSRAKPLKTKPSGKINPTPPKPRDTTRMRKPVRYLKPHRLARLIAWALAMLTWLTSVLFTERAATRRHIRRRYRLISLRALTRLVTNLATIRAVEIARIRARYRIVRNAAPCGFRRRTRPRSIKRAVIGARLRKAFKRGDLAQRIQFLIAAFRDIDAFARRYLVRRALRRLTKLCAVVMSAPPAAVFLETSALGRRSLTGVGGSPPVLANTS
jgi:hypothetical protein